MQSHPIQADALKAALAQLPPLRLPRVLFEQAPFLVLAAEQVLPGPKRGKNKKAWVRASLKALARQHDLEPLPDLVEHPLEDALIDILIEVAFLHTHEPRKVDKAEAKAG